MKKIVSPYSRWTLFWGDVCRVLPLWCLWPISCVWGMLLYYLHGGRRRYIEKGYERLCKAAGIKTSAKVLTGRFFRRQLIQMIAQYVFSEADEKRWNKFVRLEGFEGMREALAEGKGLILCSMHFGTNLLSLAKLEQEGYSIAAVRLAFMRDIKDERVRRMLFVHRDAVYVGEYKGLASPMRDALRKLRKNFVIGIAPDGDHGGEVTNVSLFGLEYPVRAGALEIARLSGSPLVFVQGTVENHKYVIRCFPVHYLREGDDPAEVTRAFFAKAIEHFEQLVRQYPECLWWTHSLEHALQLKSKDKDEDKERELAGVGQ